MSNVQQQELSDKICIYSNVFIENNKILESINDIKNQIWIRNDVNTDEYRYGVFKYANCYIGTSINNDINDFKLLERKMYFCFAKYIYNYAEKYNFNYNGIIKGSFLKYTKDSFDIPHYASVAGELGISLYYFINDDYDGGEIYFPNQDITIKGKKDQLLIVPSTADFIHFSKPVTDGIKYIYDEVVE